MTRSTRSTSHSQSWRSCSPCCIPPRPSTTWLVSPPTGPICWPSSSPASQPGSSTGSRTSRGPRRPTSCGSTWPSRPPPSRNRLGLAGGDAAGFPNGRRVTDDVVTVELRAVAGLLYPLVDPTYTVDGAAAAIEDGTFATLERDVPAGLPVPRPSVQRLRRPRRRGLLASRADAREPAAPRGQRRAGHRR